MFNWPCAELGREYASSSGQTGSSDHDLSLRIHMERSEEEQWGFSTTHTHSTPYKQSNINKH